VDVEPRERQQPVHNRPHFIIAGDEARVLARGALHTPQQQHKGKQEAGRR
jgi:hypothetical protein